MEKITRFIIIAILSGFIFACGSYHYSLYRKTAPKAPVITASDVPIEKIPRDFSGSGILNVKGVSYDIKREFLELPVDAAKEQLTRRNKLEGYSPVDTKRDRIPSTFTKEKVFDFICFVTPQNKVRGYVLDATAGGTAITSLETDIKEVASTKPYGTVPEQDIPAEHLQIMPVLPDFHIRGVGDNSSDIYSCFTSGTDKNTVIEEIRRRLSNNNWQTENWNDILKNPELGTGKNDNLLVGKKNNIMCHIMLNNESGRMVVTYRFSKTRPPQITY